MRVSNQITKLGFDEEQDLQFDVIDNSYKTVKYCQRYYRRHPFVINWPFIIIAIPSVAKIIKIRVKENTEVVARFVESKSTARQYRGYIFQAAERSLFVTQNDAIVPSQRRYLFWFADLTTM